MIQLAAEFTCPACGDPRIEKLADGRATTTHASVVVRCDGCAREWLAVLEVQLLRGSTPRDTTAARARSAEVGYGHPPRATVVPDG